MKFLLLLVGILAIPCYPALYLPTGEGAAQAYWSAIDSNQREKTLDSLFGQVKTAADCIRLFQFYIKSEAAAESFSRRWVNWLMDNPRLFKAAYKEMDRETRENFNGFAEELTPVDQLKLNRVYPDYPCFQPRE